MSSLLPFGIFGGETSKGRTHRHAQNKKKDKRFHFQEEEKPLSGR
jgi:hypothetical protein